MEKETGKICKRCKKSYTASSNTSSSCRFHPSFFVCRRHDDQKRYYELKPDDRPYAAKFYDCCWAEEPEALGCTVLDDSVLDVHVNCPRIGLSSLCHILCPRFWSCYGLSFTEFSMWFCGFCLISDCECFKKACAT